LIPAEGGEFLNINKIISRIQTALLMQGRKIRIDRMQYYSEKTERMASIYKVRESVYDEEEGKNVTIEHCSSPKQIDVLQTLLTLYKGGE
jgi:hypothetical protein